MHMFGASFVVAKVRFGSNQAAPSPPCEGLESLRVFGCLPGAGARGCTEAGVRKASREETAGEFATAVVSIYGDFAPVLDLICRLQTGTRVG
jgi:hypothetical protein